jgi:hypothetical protein
MQFYFHRDENLTAYKRLFISIFRNVYFRLIFSIFTPARENDFSARKRAVGALKYPLNEYLTVYSDANAIKFGVKLKDLHYLCGCILIENQCHLHEFILSLLAYI